MPQQILAVDQVLTQVGGISTAGDLYPYVLSMVFANAAARASRKAVSDPKAAAQAFSQQWNQRLGQVGWVITSAGTATLLTSGTGMTATVGGRISQAAGASSAIAGLFASLKAATDPANPATMLWWSAVTEGALMQGALGDVSLGSDGLQLSLTTFVLDGSRLLLPGQGILHRKANPPDLTTPHVLFQQVQAGTIDLTTSSLTAVLRADVFGASKPELEQLLAAKMKSHVASQPPGFAGQVMP